MRHYTAVEVATLVAEHSIPHLPASRDGIRRYARRADWQGRPRAGREGGGGTEYPETVLPFALRLALRGSSFMSIPAPVARYESQQVVHAARSSPSRVPRACGGGRPVERRQARLHILARFDAYHRALGLRPHAAVQLFAADYNARRLEGIDATVIEGIANLSAPTLLRWRRIRARGDHAALANGFNNRKGTKLLDVNGLGQAAVAMACKNPHLTSKQILAGLHDAFPDETMPKLRTLQRYLTCWRGDNAMVHTAMTNPDAAKARYRPAFGAMYNHIAAPNQLWEIDASPTDVLTTEGRCNLYVLTDIATRRVLISVTKHTAQAAALALIRRAIVAWGLPDTLRTDNGKDFTGRWFRQSLDHLGVHHDITAPFAPEQKAGVERVIGTIQRDLMATLPGFIGHAVADRQAIRARQSFAARLGETAEQAFCVELTPTALQQACDDWARDVYANATHSTLGHSPVEAVARWREPLRSLEDESTLRVLFAPIPSGDGLRQVAKTGIRVEGATFIAPELSLHIGKRVLVRHDPDDFGRIWVFMDDGATFIGEASNADRMGESRIAVAKEAKRRQAAAVAEARRDLKRAAKPLAAQDLASARANMGRAEARIVNLPRLPKASPSSNARGVLEGGFIVPVSTEQTKAAAEVKKPHSIVTTRVQDRDAADARYARARALEARRDDGEQLTIADADWLEGYTTTAEYGARRRLEETHPIRRRA